MEHALVTFPHTRKDPGFELCKNRCILNSVDEVERAVVSKFDSFTVHACAVQATD
jgi:hypothetical protein